MFNGYWYWFSFLFFFFFWNTAQKQIILLGRITIIDKSYIQDEKSIFTLIFPIGITSTVMWRENLKNERKFWFEKILNMKWLSFFNGRIIVLASCFSSFKIFNVIVYIWCFYSQLWPHTICLQDDWTFHHTYICLGLNKTK